MASYGFTHVASYGFPHNNKPDRNILVILVPDSEPGPREGFVMLVLPRKSQALIKGF